MKVFLDTSVLVATFYGDHERHERSFALFLAQKKSSAYTAAHCLSEVYAVVTRMPGKNRASPDEALLFLNNVRERLTSIALDDTEYFEVLEKSASLGFAGGTIYDAIIARCALKAKAQELYTCNVKHFRLLGEDVASRVKQP